MMPSCIGLFISLSHGRKRNEPKRKATGCISEAKKWRKIPKTGKRASLERARFFTEFSAIFLYASPKRPELYSEIRENREERIESREIICL
jgi:hypothetical protein